MPRESRPLELRDIALLRLRNQRLAGPGFAAPADLVGWLGAVQSQDYAGAKWALAQRLDDEIFAQSRDALSGALKGGKHLTRAELGRVLSEAAIEARGCRALAAELRRTADRIQRAQRRVRSGVSGGSSVATRTCSQTT